MYDLNFKNARKGYGTGIIFCIVGLIFLTFAGLTEFRGLIKKISFDSKIEASRIGSNYHPDSDGNYMYSLIYYYEVDGVEYVCVSSYPSRKSVSPSKNHVYYDSKNPTNCVTEDESGISFITIFVFLFFSMFILLGLSEINRVRKHIKKMKYLATNGMLVQNLQYTMVETNITVNDRPIYAIAVDYTLPSGTVVHLVGDPRYDGQLADSDGLVDLLIDPNDIKNYYIDFNINRR